MQFLTRMSKPAKERKKEEKKERWIWGFVARENEKQKWLVLFQTKLKVTFFALHVDQQGQRIANGDRTGGATACNTKASSHLHLTLRRIDCEHNWRTGVYSVGANQRNQMKQIRTIKLIEFTIIIIANGLKRQEEWDKTGPGQPQCVLFETFQLNRLIMTQQMVIYRSILNCAN